MYLPNRVKKFYLKEYESVRVDEKEEVFLLENIFHEVHYFFLPPKKIFPISTELQP